MIPVAEAQARVLALARPLPPEPVALRAAAGRVLAADAVALRDQPPFDCSAMDGWAVRAAEAPAGARRAAAGAAAAGGGRPGPLAPGSAMRIFTGAPVPDGADAVVIQEEATLAEGRVAIAAAAAPGDNIRRRGGDFAAGARLAAPRRLSAADLALLAAMGVATPAVARRPVVAIAMTGDELVLPGETPAPDQIFASNGYGLLAMAEAEGADVRLLPIARDRPETLAAVLGLAREADVVVTVGGASVGDHDLVGRVASGMGLERAFWKVAMRPGKPLMAGRLGEAILLGLPGNPVSALVCGHLFLLPLLRALQGLAAPLPRPRRAVLSRAVEANGPRAHYMRATLLPGDPLPAIRPFPSQDSSLLMPLAAADALLVRPPGAPAEPEGAMAEYLPLTGTG
ncbi:MAG: molybdopterin molybdotransferase MoeA [Rhodobacteraceae bacterium]|nr:molybdopterin molybdotransferase MoeA [Paracoccaceae bacterium]